MAKITTEDRFDVTVKDVGIGESKNTGTPYIYFYFQTAEGDGIGAYQYLSEKAAEYTLPMLEEVFGFDNNFNNLEQFKGKPANITTGFEDDNKGGQQLRVKFINKPFSAPPPAPANLVDKLNRMAHQRAGKPYFPGKQAAATPKPSSTAVDDGEPF